MMTTGKVAVALHIVGLAPMVIVARVATDAPMLHAVARVVVARVVVVKAVVAKAVVATGEVLVAAARLGRVAGSALGVTHASLPFPRRIGMRRWPSCVPNSCPWPSS